MTYKESLDNYISACKDYAGAVSKLSTVPPKSTGDLEDILQEIAEKHRIMIIEQERHRRHCLGLSLEEIACI